MLAMNIATLTHNGLQGVIEQLQKQKEELNSVYLAAINNGEKLNEVKALYISLKDVDKRLDELMRIIF